MKTAVIIPTQKEFDFFVEYCTKLNLITKNSLIGKLSVMKLPELGIILVRGGLGKTQFAIHTQHLIDVYPHWDLVICTGAAGALAKNLSVGDVVVATETIEHDIYNKFGKPLLPRFSGAKATIESFRHLTPTLDGIHFGSIASGDEDVIDDLRKQEIHTLTGATAVAWEGAGGARACEFNGVPFVEIRVITDTATSEAATDFEVNLENSMHNLANLIINWKRSFTV